MPCNDVTERICVTIDQDDRLAEYAFRKKTCGRGVGADTLLLDELRGRAVDDLLAIEAEAFVSARPVEDSPDLDMEIFLALKHVFAIQSALRVLIGREPGGKDDPCKAATIEYEPDGAVVVTAHIDVKLMTEKIKSCGNCKGCGTAKNRKIVFN